MQKERFLLAWMNAVLKHDEEIWKKRNEKYLLALEKTCENNKGYVFLYFFCDCDPPRLWIYKTQKDLDSSRFQIRFRASIYSRLFFICYEYIYLHSQYNIR